MNQRDNLLSYSPGLNRPDGYTKIKGEKPRKIHNYACKFSYHSEGNEEWGSRLCPESKLQSSQFLLLLCQNPLQLCSYSNLYKNIFQIRIKKIISKYELKVAL